MADAVERVEQRGNHAIGAQEPHATGTQQRPGERRPVDLSSFELVNHYFDLAADRLGIPDDVPAVLRSSYREVPVGMHRTRARRRPHARLHHGLRGSRAARRPVRATRSKRAC
jgi:hypothetical protein